MKNINIITWFNKRKNKKDEVENISTEEENKFLIEPLSLTQNQIDEIHARGKLTPKEAVEEWEDYGLCPPASMYEDVINTRCCEFKHNCHNCLTDYANNSIEHNSFFEDLIIPSNKTLVKNKSIRH